MTASTVAALRHEALDVIAFVDAALAVARHEITDPVLREHVAAVAAGQVSAEQALAASRQHLGL